jgi:ABC-type Na+ transport system ATPase subunit NatA
MDHVARLCTHAVVIREGKLAAKGTLDELRALTGKNDLEEIFLELTARPAQR